jgi:type II secretory pathway pseudopilin PulG
MLRAEIDPVQIAIIIIAMGAGFVQWVWGLIQQAREERERRQAAPADEVMETLREEAWRRQVKPPSPQATRPIHEAGSDPWSAVRQLLEKAQEAAKAPAAPPPLPKTAPARSPVREPVAAKLAPPPPRAPTPPAPIHADFPLLGHKTARSRVNALARQLRDPGSVRQAVLLREILGPPKALQTPPDVPL